ncbi:phosphomannomutase CpsG [Xenorhabdus lircayensis]|uniref:Phosphomannomutase n=1 Tax=Xenorhabdus lircayensis TaxID=2763499 RepID=A0ABS0U2B6_9GAMM|nr:phosphomannomutase CpsG [Xenorhabdus lircayensis]MBI6548027.1 phosphomannomutase CpsG [Xenorhabdus lircayensis]
MKDKLNCFKAYDIRGQLGQELNEDIAYRIGRAYSEFIKPKSVVVGHDSRLTSEKLKLALSRGLQDSGTDVLDIGLAGTEEIYFATFFLGICGGIEVTASHNPINYNGMKLVREDAKPISRDSGLKEIQSLAEINNFPKINNSHRGDYKKISILESYIDHILNYIDLKKLKPLRLVINSGNGTAGHVIDAIEYRFKALNIPVEFIKIHHESDGTFPNGIPNPLLPECRKDTSEAVITHNADIGIAFDGDFDRCFFFDERGNFIEGYYIVGLLAEAFLKNNPGQKIIHDPRLTWNTIDIVTLSDGIPIISKAGHSFIKEKMRKENAIYGGEMSAHHYFRDFSYCDSGMIPWLLIIELVSIKKIKLSQLVKERINKYPSSGEINKKSFSPDETINNILNIYQKDAVVDYTDGISLEFYDWRFNLRISNTEPVIRLNVESKGDFELMKNKTKEILALLP